MTGERRLEAFASVGAVQRQQALLDRRGDEARELGRRLPGSQLHQHARYRADPEVAAGADIVGVGLGLRAMDGQAGVRPAAAPRQRHLDVADVDGSQAPDGRGGPMAEKRTWADAQKGGHEVGMAGQACVADGVDVVMDAVQATEDQPPLDLRVGEAEVIQLLARDRTELPRRNSG